MPLVVLSACQTAAQGASEEPFGSVAARLSASGIPAVLAMTHSVLVPTTRALFGKFYGEAARRRTIGEALDEARLLLYNHPEKYEVQRGKDREWLRLADWFVPSLYQAGADPPLIKAVSQRGTPVAEVNAPRTNLPVRPEAGFFGRRYELWQIERWFADETRRISICGFGGQGKTALAQETARWLTRTGMFQAAVFVDYSCVQGEDALAVAVSNIGGVLGLSLVDTQAATQALRQTSTLVVLDNLEALAPAPLRELLDVAREWSEVGSSRVLATSRAPDLSHTAFQIEGTHMHRRILLAGLGSREAPDDALEWFAELSKLPPQPEVPTPKREALVQLFDQVRFHPLSLGVLAEQLKTRRPAELGRRLEELLRAAPSSQKAENVEDATPPELVASLNLSLDRLDAAARTALPKLGVFDGGAFEDHLLVITGFDGGAERARIERLLAAAERSDRAALVETLNVSGEFEISQAKIAELVAHVRKVLPTLPSGIDTRIWPALRRQLEQAGLIQVESVRARCALSIFAFPSYAHAISPWAA